jgi:hypothetical protein
MNLEKFLSLITQWSKVRGIDNLSWQSQLKLYYEETFECRTAVDQSELIMEYGDRIVCLANCGLIMFELNDSHAEVDYVRNRFSHLNEMLESDLESAICNRDWIKAIHLVIDEMVADDISPAECFQKTWDKIKDRKGMIIGDKWVKWKDLTEDQRKEYTEREKEFL